MPQKPLQMPDLSSYRDLGEIFRSAVEERGKVAFFPVPEYPPTTEDERIAKLEARLEVLEEFITRNSFEARTGIKIFQNIPESIKWTLANKYRERSTGESGLKIDFTQSYGMQQGDRYIPSRYNFERNKTE